MKNYVNSTLVVFAATLLVTLALLCAARAAVPVHKLYFACADNSRMEAIIYWDPDQVKITKNKLILLLPAQSGTSGLDFADKNYRFHSTGKNATLTNLRTKRSVSCTVTRR